MPYKVPLYRRIGAADGIDLTVVYASTMGVGTGAAGYTGDVIWDVDLLSGYRSMFLPRAESNAGDGLRFTGLTDPEVVPLLWRGRFDVLFSEGYHSLTHMFAVLTQRGRRSGVVMREEQTLLHPRSLPKTLVKEVAMRALFAQLDAAVYISSENRRWLEHYGLRTDRLFASPYSPDSDYFAAEARRLRPQRATLRESWGFLPDAGPIVVSVSRLAPQKQTAMLIEAFRRVRAEQRCGLLLVGSGPLDAELRAVVARERIPDVCFAGFLNHSEVSRAYAAADVFALLSGLNETFGISVAEAAHFGLPLLLSDKVGSGPDLLGDGANGHLVPRDDIDAATRALGRLVSDADLRVRFGAESLRRISERGLDQAVGGALAAIRFAAACRASNRSPLT
jgi:glycosyltransferase involved in cell wall biosynthesis